MQAGVFEQKVGGLDAYRQGARSVIWLFQMSDE